MMITRANLNEILFENHDARLLIEDVVSHTQAFEKGKYVTITDEELEKIKTRKDKTLHVEHFAKMSDIDSLYYERNYYVVPNIGAEKAFELLRQAMISKKEVAIAKTVMGTKEELVVLYPTKDTIIAKMLYYQEEIQDMPKSQAKVQIEKSELEMAKTLVCIVEYMPSNKEGYRQATFKGVRNDKIASECNISIS